MPDFLRVIALCKNWTLKICNQDISKSIARSFKPDRLVEEKVIFYSNYCPFAIWTLKICYQDILKSITARSFKLGQLIEDDE